MKILIVEDEQPARQEMLRILKKVDATLEVVDVLDSICGTVAFLQHEIVDLIFMDIQLSDGTCFEIFSHIPVNIPVIFTTAYNEFALQAFKVHSIDYLLKPITEDDVFRALDKYKRLYTGGTGQFQFSLELLDQLMQTLGRKTYKARFVLHVGDRIKHVDVASIAWFRAESNTVFVNATDGGKFIVDYSLEQLTELLDPVYFFRLNRTYLAHYQSVKDIRKYFNSRLKVYLNPAPDEDVLVSRVRVPDFLSWLDK